MDSAESSNEPTNVRPELHDYVICEFVTGKKKIHFVGKVISFNGKKNQVSQVVPQRCNFVQT